MSAQEALPSNYQLILYDEQKTAELLGVSKRWLQTARQTGNGPRYVKVGRLVGISPPRHRELDFSPGKKLYLLIRGLCCSCCRERRQHPAEYIG